MRISCLACEVDRRGSTYRFHLCDRCAPLAAKKLRAGKWAEVPRDDAARYEAAGVDLVVANAPGLGSQREGQREAAWVPAWARAFSADLEAHPAELGALLALCARSDQHRAAFASAAAQCERREDVPRALLELLAAARGK